jgi:hypothetical protein
MNEIDHLKDFILYSGDVIADMDHLYKFTSGFLLYS